VPLLLLAYMIVAFIAGLVALAMPCCFSVLLPSYFAQSFKQKTRLIGMTLIFSVGIATVMLPIALGVVVLAQAIRGAHNLVFVAGGFLMILVGFWTLWGHGMLPQLNFPVSLRRTDSPSVYVLGVFSGAATTCCAPVLAGVLVLTALSASLLEGLLIGLAYVAGMVFPLFLAALLWERYATRNVNPLSGRLFQFRLFGQEYSFDASKFIAGITFTLMGVVTVILGIGGTMLPTPGTAYVAVMQSQFADALVKFFSGVGNIDTALVGGALLVLGTGLLLRNRAKKSQRLRDSKMNPEMIRTRAIVKPPTTNHSRRSDFAQEVGSS
jgi:cytochrome c-type biogenesis protein